MAAIFKRAKPVAVDFDVLSVATSGKNGQKLAAAAAAALKPRVKKEIERQYANLLTQIGAVLREPGAHGLGNPRAGGSRTIRLKDAHGANVDVRTPNWAPLTKKYIRRAAAFNRQSIYFWAKSRGKSPAAIGLGPRARSLYKNYRAATTGQGKVAVTTGKLAARLSGRQTNFRQAVTFTFNSLPPPLEEIILGTFIAGKRFHQLQLSRNYDRNSVGVVAYPEHFRPLLSVIAAQLSHSSERNLRAAAQGQTRGK